MNSCSFLSCFPAHCFDGYGSARGKEHCRGNCPPPDSNPFSEAEFGKNLVNRQAQSLRARRTTAFNSKNAVNFLSACTMNRFPSRCVDNPDGSSLRVANQVISSQLSDLLAFSFGRESALWGLRENLATAFMSFGSTNVLGRCRKCDYGTLNAIHQNHSFILD